MIDAEKKSWIPVVSKMQIYELSKRIKPVVRFKSKGLCYIKPVDLFEVSFIWDSRSADKAISLKAICDITTYHTFGYHGLFKPSIAEVLSQIPAQHRIKVMAFEIVESPETVGDLNKQREALNAGYHVATTRLYARE